MDSTQVLVFSKYGGGYSIRLPIKDALQLEKIKKVLAPLGFNFRAPRR